jgi:hypothetical protein
MIEETLLANFLQPPKADRGTQHFQTFSPRLDTSLTPTGPTKKGNRFYVKSGPLFHFYSAHIRKKQVKG